MDECIEQAQEQGARRAVKLKVSGAFHSPLVARAADRLRPAIERVHFQEPVSPFMSTVTARLESAHRMGPLLVDQLTAPVRFTQSASELMREGVRTFVEVGPGNVLSGLVKRIDRSVKAVSVNNLDCARPASASCSPRACASRRWRGRRRSSRARRGGSGARSRRSSRAAGAAVVVGYRSGREEAEALAPGDRRAARSRPTSRAPEEAARLVAEAGDLDVLVNNAGLTRDGLLARMPTTTGAP